ncbi:REP-associated tyrosine transposase [Vannielia litorea]|uniref:REP-associated tyrosine transposase n=1 Tax=Vannielia litorea TaxID=1217970 RepID=UPI001BCEDF15|nr:transposase [Vannielia litorea]MBS8228750.1 transposase [Vannielia litorea]
MSCYHRPRLNGASIFFTVCIARRGSSQLIDNVHILREAVRVTKRERPFHIDAWVVMPDHLHCVWTLPATDADYATRWSVIKARVSRARPHSARRASHAQRREHGFWQRRFWEHHLRSPADKATAIEYCWVKPVKHGLVERPEDWDCTSWHREHRAA